MRLAVARVNSPMRLVLPVDRLRSGYCRAFVVIGGRPREFERLRALVGAWRAGKRTNLGEMEIAVVPASGSALRQAIVGQDLKPHRTQLPRGSAGGDDVA